LIEEAVVSASRSSRRRVRLAASALFVGVAALSAVTACSAGQIAQTAREVPAVPGANVDIAGPNGVVASLRDMMVVYNGPQGYPQGGTAPLVIRIFNSGGSPVTLTKVEADAADSVTLIGGPQGTPSITPAPTFTSGSPSTSASASTSASGSPSGSASATGSASGSANPTGRSTPVPTRPAGSANFNIDVTPASYVLLVPGQGPYLQLNGLKSALMPGQSVKLTFTFSGGLTGSANIPMGVPQSDQPRATPVESNIGQQAGEGEGGD
jgi:hypothetical protein